MSTLESIRDALAPRYVVEDELGRGGMAVVYLATDTKHGRKVAVKVLNDEVAQVLGAERFLREIEIAAKLQHPHILTLHDSGDANGTLYYVMPYVDGESLRDRLNRESMTWEEAVDIADEVASALDYAHEQGIVHRDIKPGNILLSQGHATVADFGIARALTSSVAQGNKDLTQVDFAVGTPSYMSPEQATGDPSLDGRADIYALGCVFYEMLDGRPPYEGPTAQAVIAKGISEPIPKLKNRGVPVKLHTVIGKALAKEPAERYETGRAFREALRTLRVADASPARSGGLAILGSLVVLALGYVVTYQVGMPDWVFQGTAILVVLMVAATLGALAVGASGKGPAWLQMRSVMNAGLGGLAVFAVLVSGYVGLRAFGIGPAAALTATGAFDELDRVLVAEFENRTSDSLIGTAISEALRVDLAQSPVLSVVDDDAVGTVLARMQRPPGTPLSSDVAREVAVREGYEAILEGDVTPVGTGFQLAARLVGVADNEVLASFRETASDGGAVIDAIDALSKSIRAKVGESFRSLRSNPRLSRVSTSSLEALQRYSAGGRALSSGDVPRAVRLFEEAFAIDTTFAMAYRAAGQTLANLNRQRSVDLLNKALEYQDRLTERERDILLGTYHSTVTSNTDEAIAAFQNMLDRNPNDYGALNSLAAQYMASRDYAQAEELFRRAIAQDTLELASYANLAVALLEQGKRDEAQVAMDDVLARFPDQPQVLLNQINLSWDRKDYDSTEALIIAFGERYPGHPLWEPSSLVQRGLVYAVRGQLRESERFTEDGLERLTALNIPGLSIGQAIQLAFYDTWLRNDNEGAVRRLEEALARDPIEAIAPLNRPYQALAQVYTFAGRVDLARQMLAELEGAIEEQYRIPLEPGRQAILGMIALAEERPSDAIEHFEAGDSDQCPSCILPFRALAFAQADSIDAAIATFERYVNEPEFIRALVDYAFLPFAYEQLGQLYARQGNAEQAIDWYQRFVNVWENADPELQPRVRAAREAIQSLAQTENR